MKIDIISLFPRYFEGPFNESILKRAQKKGLLELNSIDLREFGEGKHKRVDDRVYGGGPGMLLMASPIKKAIDFVRRPDSYIVSLSPQGKLLSQSICQELSKKSHLILLAGHYEGIDDRIEVDEEISIGDYVLTNGALPAIVIVDSVARLIPGVLGDERSFEEESFNRGLFDCPHYTKPLLFQEKAVPPVLLGGDHQAILEWRSLQSRIRTCERRPDLYISYLGKSEIDSENLSLVFTSENLKKDVKFYTKIFGFTLLSQTETHAYFKEGITLAKGVKNAYPVLLIYSLRSKKAFDEILSKLVREKRIQGSLREIKGGYEVSFTDEEERAWLLRYVEEVKDEIE